METQPPSHFPLYRNWYEFANGIKQPKRRLAFYDQLFALAFDNVKPAADELGQMVVAVVKGIGSLSDKRREAGRKGGIQSGIARSKRSKSEANEARRTIEMKGNERKGNEESASPAHARGVPMDVIRETGRKLGVPPEFTAYFAAEMDKLGWRSMKPDGRTYAVTDANVAATLRNWWNVEKKNNPRAPSAVPADVPRGASCADDDATPDWARAAGGAE